MSDSEPMQPGDDRERELSAAPDDFFETPGFSRWAKWVIVAFVLMTAAAIAVPLIAAYTSLL